MHSRELEDGQSIVKYEIEEKLITIYSTKSTMNMRSMELYASQGKARGGMEKGVKERKGEEIRGKGRGREVPSLEDD